MIRYEILHSGHAWGNSIKDVYIGAKYVISKNFEEKPLLPFFLFKTKNRFFQMVSISFHSLSD